MIDWDKYINDLTKIDKILEDMGFSQDERNSWYLSPSLAFENNSPIDLISNGNGQRIISCLLGLAQGNV